MLPRPSAGWCEAAHQRAWRQLQRLAMTFAPRSADSLAAPSAMSVSMRWRAPSVRARSSDARGDQERSCDGASSSPSAVWPASVTLAAMGRRTQLARLRAITTPFDMAVFNDLDQFQLASDALGRLPQLGARAAYMKQALANQLTEHRRTFGATAKTCRQFVTGAGPHFVVSLSLAHRFARLDSNASTRV
jgi:XFP-like protein